MAFEWKNMSVMGRVLIIGGSAVLMVAALVALIAGVYLFQLSRGLPDYDNLAQYEPPQTTRVHAGDGTLIAEFATQRRLFVPYEDIPPNVVEAFLSAEDKNFFNHPGIDAGGILRASLTNIYNAVKGRRLEGASTITQQVARNFLLSSERTVSRKIKEAMLSLRIEHAYSKEQILSLYLNEIYLGNASYGVAAAAQNYFDKALNELTLSEVAYLAALPKAPNNYNPVIHRQAAVARRNWVIQRMADDGFIPRDQARAAQAEPLVTHTRPFGAQFQEAKFFTEDVRREVSTLYGDKSLYDGGLSVRTTLDMDYQRIAIKVLRDGLSTYDRRHGWRGPVTQISLGNDWQKQLAHVPTPHDIAPWRLSLVLDVGKDKVRIGFADGSKDEIPFEGIKWARKFLSNTSLGPEVKQPNDVLKAGDVVYVAPASREDGTTYLALRQIPAVNGAVVAMDPHTGRVLALVGGFSYDASEFDRATQALRQTGSAFKPFVYAAALDNGFTPVSVVLDAPFVMDQGAGLGIWNPENYTEDFAGPSTLRRGLEKSRNTMTVRLASTIGMEPIVEYAKRFGIKDDMPPYLAMALGAGETTLIKLTAAYATFVNGGKKVMPTLIDRVQDRHGKTIFRHDERSCSDCNQTFWNNQEEPALPDPRAEILSPATAYQIVSMLEGVVQRGTGTAVKAVGVPLAGKTGTTNDERDAWFIGFSPDLCVGVFVGFDQPKPMGKGETGGHVAAPVFRDFMKAVIGDRPGVPFRVPADIRLVAVDSRTGELANPGDPNVILEAFKPGTEPGGDLAVETSAVEGAERALSAAPSKGVSGGTGGLY